MAVWYAPANTAATSIRRNAVPDCYGSAPSKRLSASCGCERVLADADTSGSGGSEWTLGNSSGAAVTFATDGFTAGRRGRAERGQPELHTIKTVGIVVIIFARYTVATRRFDGPAGLFRRGRAEGRHHCRARGTRPASVAVHVAGQGTQVLPHRRPAAQPGRPRGRAHVP